MSADVWRRERFIGGDDTVARGCCIGGGGGGGGACPKVRAEDGE
jgi:hypothetical protein